MEQLFPRDPLESNMQKLAKSLWAVRVFEKQADRLDPSDVILAQERFSKITSSNYNEIRSVAQSLLPTTSSVMDGLSEQYALQQGFYSQRNTERAREHYQIGATFGLARCAINASQQETIEEAHPSELPGILRAVGVEPHSDFTDEDEMHDPIIACMVEDFSQEMSRDLAENPEIQDSMQRSMRSGYRAACIVSRQTVIS